MRIVLMALVALWPALANAQGGQLRLSTAFDAAVDALVESNEIAQCLTDRRDLIFFPLTDFEPHVSDSMRRIINEASWDALDRSRYWNDRVNVIQAGVYHRDYRTYVAGQALQPGRQSAFSAADDLKKIYEADVAAFITLQRNHPTVVEVVINLAAYNRATGETCHVEQSPAVYFDLATERARPERPPLTAFTFVDLSVSLRRGVAAAITEARAQNPRIDILPFVPLSDFSGALCQAEPRDLIAQVTAASAHLERDPTQILNDAIAGNRVVHLEAITEREAASRLLEGPVLTVRLVALGAHEERDVDAQLARLVVTMRTEEGRRRVGPSVVVAVQNCGEALAHSLEVVESQMKTTPRYFVELTADGEPFMLGDDLTATLKVPLRDGTFSQIHTYCWIMSDDEANTWFPNPAYRSAALRVGDYAVPRDFGIQPLTLSEQVHAALHCFVSGRPLPPELHAKWVADFGRSLDAEAITGILTAFRDVPSVSEVMAFISIASERAAR
ncbi:MAG: hypothetical protein AAF318_03940 [Pseudomonadota bacterium]